MRKNVKIATNVMLLVLIAVLLILSFYQVIAAIDRPDAGFSALLIVINAVVILVAAMMLNDEPWPILYETVPTVVGMAVFVLVVLALVVGGVV